MSAVPSRRAFVAGITTLPLIGLGAAEPASDLIGACDWAITHSNWINICDEDWTDETLDREVDRIEAVIHRAAEEPSRSRPQLLAKARLGLHNWLQEHPDPEQCSELEVLLTTILREVIAFGERAD